MMWRSKDHRSAWLWWSLSLSGGGYGRFLKSLLALIIILSQLMLPWIALCWGPPWPVDKRNNQLTFHHYPLQMVLIWAAMGDLLVFSALPHPLRHFLRHWPQLVPPQIVFWWLSLLWTAGQLAMDHWVVWRTSSLPHFLGFGWCYGGSPSSGYLPCLMVNEEDHS